MESARVLNFALALEQLETAFYAEGLHNYTHQEFLDAGFPDPFHTNLQQVARNERAHVDFLTQALTGMCGSIVASRNIRNTRNIHD